MIKNQNLRLLYEDVITSLAFSGFFETKEKTTWVRKLKREEDGQELIVSVGDTNDVYAGTPILIRMKE